MFEGAIFATTTVSQLITYFNESNLAGQVIVVLLLVFSVWAWSLMLGKYMELTNAEKQNRNFDRNLNHCKSVMEAYPKDAKFPAYGPYADMLKSALDAYHRYSNSDEMGALKMKSEHAMGHVENALQRAVAYQSNIYEARMVTLSAIVSGAPFFGLLGTVWGVMDAFGGLAMATGPATIQTLAPGVSGALLTTVAGLVVAIPSVFGYNLLLQKMKLLITDLENFASSLADRIELELVK